MVTAAQWKVSCDHAENHAEKDGVGDYKPYLRRFVASWAFRNALEDSGIKCPAPMSEDILVEGNTNVFQVKIIADRRDDKSLVSIPFDGKYYSDIYIYYDVNQMDEPWETFFLGACDERLMKHHGFFRNDTVYYYVNRLWPWQKFVHRLKHDLKGSQYG